ncbi:hypothetical protein VL04_14790 [Chromobacterium violaceum]|uniref:hypothetical protein n=1 Tax=Chromobacterium violaceum TaxID=536 RepID=UPI000653D475|nr:hypothetical protein [Chromobacterium violaceum]UGA39482.1 hypothetical protein JOS77_08330 [Chromobacterium haemolyticum]KMN50616.1 hypothetical protein VK93_04255 [Chromobacterium violaceum]KMN87112.1 hypothetical protein VL02_04605 [Chromobacterium violaceum]KMN89763.1 hypothetical protein VL04_14790 [Chromobacterium violaceum]KMO03807.1 hypothetical protein VL16_12545 [Chromobacterium violaceum]
MTTWDYRVIEFETAAAGEAEPHRWRAIHEVFYNNDGQPAGYGENPADVLWGVEEDDSSPANTLARMQAALTKPVLYASDF